MRDENSATTDATKVREDINLMIFQTAEVGITDDVGNSRGGHKCNDITAQQRWA